MGQMWHPGASRFAALALFAIACSGGDAASEGPPGEQEPGEEEPGGATEPTDESLLSFAIDGRNEPLGAQARLEVRQGVESVHLGITGANSGSDLVVFDIFFSGVESTMGDHVIDLGLPDRVENYANVNLDGTFYYSQGGRIELSLSEDGAIEGRFDVNLAPDLSEPGAPPLPFAATDNPMPLTGVFEGSWVLSCQSRFPGHETLMRGGAFCEELHF